MGIVWIASYPKSGNTWVRFLLANYLAGPIRESAGVEHLIPGFSPLTDGAGLVRERSVVFGKTHYLWGPSHPSATLTDCAVVIVRHPKDVLLSNLNYRRLATGTERGFSDEAYARAFIESGGDVRWFAEGFGTLAESTRSWLDLPDAPPRLLVRYEDLKEDMGRELSRILGFLGVPVDAERLKMAVGQSGFDQMRAMEVRERVERKNGVVFPGPPPRTGWARYFMNSGRVRGSLGHIGPDLDGAFDKRFGPLMERLGYATAM